MKFRLNRPFWPILDRFLEIKIFKIFLRTDLELVRGRNTIAFSFWRQIKSSEWLVTYFGISHIRSKSSQILCLWPVFNWLGRSLKMLQTSRFWTFYTSAMYACVC